MAEIITSKKEALKRLHTSLDLSNCSQKLRDDKEVVLLAVEKNPFCLQYASPRLKSDSDIICEAARQDYGALKYANKDILDDKNTMLKIVSYASMALEFAGENVKDSKEVIENALMHKGLSLKYASNRLKEDKELVLKSLSNCYFITSYMKELIPESLKNDKELYHIILDSYDRVNVAGFKMFNPEVCDDKDIITKAIKKSADNMRYASERLKEDKVFVLFSLKEKCNIFEYISKTLQNDKEVVLEALILNKANIRFASEDIYSLIKEEDEPVNYLKTLILNEKLEEELNNKSKTHHKVKL